MFKKIRNISVTIIALIILMNTFSANSVSATAQGMQGYAVYRDGVFLGVEWHAGIMNQSSQTPWVDSVIHHPGTGYVKKDTWTGFMNGNNTYKGTYKPNTSQTADQRMLFVTKARELATENIEYNVYYQVNYAISTAGDWVDANEITSMRCDGVVEYIYEWYGFKVYANGDYWDVTKAGLNNKETHAGVAITPSKQKNYLTAV